MTQTAQTAQEFTLGEHTFRPMDGIYAAFGADRSDYPEWDNIPDEYKQGRSKGERAFSGLLFNGGKLADHGFELKPDVDPDQFYTLLRALMSSFAPKHEVKMATCGWLIETYCTPTGAA